MSLTIVTPPAVEPIDAQEVRERFRITSSANDDALDSFIVGARTWVENWLGRALITQTWDLKLDEFPVYASVSDRIRIPRPPLQSVTGVTYYDAGGALQTMAPAGYRVLSGEPAQIQVLTTWPSLNAQGDAIAVRFVAGYGIAPTSVPEPIRQAIAILAAAMGQVSRPDMLLRSETAEGIGSAQYSSGDGVLNAVYMQVKAMMSPYLVWVV